MKVFTLIRRTKIHSTSYLVFYHYLIWLPKPKKRLFSEVNKQNKAKSEIFYLLAPAYYSSYLTKTLI